LDWRDRLRFAIEKSGKKYSVIAHEAGIDPSTISRILTRRRELPAFDTVVRIARAINENVGWLLDERGFSLSSHEQRQLRDAARVIETALHTTARSRREARPESNAVPASANREIPRAFAALGARLIYEAAGDSMIGAGIADRDFLFVKPATNPRDAAGRIVVCRIGGAEYVKQLDVRGGRMRLLSRNDAFAPIDVRERDDEFELVGIVVGRAGAIAG
jgi:SOS-response transcriptional repressor LexA